jgi:hypothetical protein
VFVRYDNQHPMAHGWATSPSNLDLIG